MTKIRKASKPSLREIVGDKMLTRLVPPDRPDPCKASGGFGNMLPLRDETKET